MKKIKFMVIAAILSLACVLGFVACNNDTQTFPTEPMTITLNKTTLDIERHEEFTLTATVNNGSGTVYWECGRHGGRLFGRRCARRFGGYGYSQSNLR